MIIIIGDSWGVGEWDKDCNLNGPGLGQYLMLHDKVCNLSVGGASNTMSLNRLQQFLHQYRINPCDIIYWIVTCPSRDCDIATCLPNKRSFKQIWLDSLFNSFSIAQTMAESYGTNLNLIGGLCDLNELDLSVYARLKVSVASWCQLIDTKYIPGTFCPDDWISFGNDIKAHHSHHLDEWQNIADMIIRKNHIWSQIFHTDGSHPDRHGHKILHNHLYPEWAWKIG